MKAFLNFVFPSRDAIHSILDASGELKQIVGIVLIRHECFLTIAIRGWIPQPGAELFIDHLVENWLAHRIQIAGCF